MRIERNLLGSKKKFLDKREDRVAWNEAEKEYHVCMCGKSQNQPLCDGSHAGSGLGPKVFKATEAGFVAFCGCKHSKDETGKCDGTHSSL